MPNALNTLKNISFNFWLYCGVLIVLVLWFVGYINRHPTESEIASRATRHYEEHYNKVQPNEKVPVYDYQKYHYIKLDGRYFLIPRVYGGFKGVAFFWPSKIPYALYKKGDEMDENKALIEVYMESKNSPIGIETKKLKITDKNVCNQNVHIAFYWSDVLIWMRFAKKTHQQDWPLICAETLRILSLAKEVKSHD